VDSTAPKVARFGLFELDLVSRELRKQGLKINLAEQPVQILQLQFERAGEMVTREELRNGITEAFTTNGSRHPAAVLSDCSREIGTLIAHSAEPHRVPSESMF